MTTKTDDQLIDEFLATPGTPIDPELPANWDSTPHDARPDSHRRLWNRPYIVTHTQTGPKAWLEAWPSGTRYTVRCLDGGSWDRSTNCGSFAKLDDAFEIAEQLDQLRRDLSPRVVEIDQANLTPAPPTIAAKLTITITGAQAAILQRLTEGLDGDDLRMTEYGKRLTLNDDLREFLLERLSPDYDDLPAWYDDDWDFSVKIEL